MLYQAINSNRAICFVFLFLYILFLYITPKMLAVERQRTNKTNTTRLNGNAVLHAHQPIRIRTTNHRTFAQQIIAHLNWNGKNRRS